MHPVVFFSLAIAGGAASTLLTNVPTQKVMAFVTFTFVTGLFVSSWLKGGKDRRNAIGFVVGAIGIALAVWAVVTLLVR